MHALAVQAVPDLATSNDDPRTSSVPAVRAIWNFARSGDIFDRALVGGRKQTAAWRMRSPYLDLLQVAQEPRM